MQCLFKFNNNLKLGFKVIIFDHPLRIIIILNKYKGVPHEKL